MSPRTLPGLDLARLESWIAREHPELLVGEPLRARMLVGGLSNLSYAVSGGREAWVLRRPPLGHVLSTAHDMGREHRVLSALQGSGVPVPVTRVYARDDDGEAGVGTEFYLMDFMPGAVLAHRADNEGIPRAHLAALGTELAETLATLHGLDPAAVGLSDFGRPEGFLDRQLLRWGRQLDASRSRDVTALDRLAALLREDVPPSAHPGIVHGDFRLDNTLVEFGPAGPRITAVLDWEMSTLGDPLTDLGLLGVYWDMHRIEGAAGSPLASAIDPDAGYPEFDAIVDHYAATRGLVLPRLGWYRAFACFKLAVILEGIHYRFTQGHTVGPGFSRVGRIVPGLAERGLELHEGKA